MPDTTPKPDVRLVLTAKRTNGWHIATIKADVQVMTGEGIRSPYWSGAWACEHEPTDAYAELAVYAQANTDDNAPSWYGWELAYRDAHTVDLDRAQWMVKTLRRANQRMDALAHKYGRPDTLAAYLARVADALGVTSARPYGVHVTAEHDFDGTGYRWMDADALAYHLASELRERSRVAA